MSTQSAAGIGASTDPGRPRRASSGSSGILSDLVSSLTGSGGNHRHLHLARHHLAPLEPYRQRHRTGTSTTPDITSLLSGLTGSGRYDRYRDIGARAVPERDDPAVRRYRARPEREAVRVGFDGLHVRSQPGVVRLLRAHEVGRGAFGRDDPRRRRTPVRMAQGAGRHDVACSRRCRRPARCCSTSPANRSPGWAVSHRLRTSRSVSATARRSKRGPRVRRRHLRRGRPLQLRRHDPRDDLTRTRHRVRRRDTTGRLVTLSA